MEPIHLSVPTFRVEETLAQIRECLDEGWAPRAGRGQISLYRVDWSCRRAEFGRLLIGEADATGRGLASEAMTLLIGHAVSTWGLREIELEVFADNAAAIALYAAQGFEVCEQRGPMLRMRRITMGE